MRLLLRLADTNIGFPTKMPSRLRLHAMHRLRKRIPFAQKVAFLLACGLLLWTQSRLLVSVSPKHNYADFLTYPTNNLLNNVSTTEQETSIVVVVPGHGDPARLPLLKSTLWALQQSSESTVDFACLVYVWKQALLDNITQELDFCLVEFSSGL
jgi:hypothetical protein